MSNGENVVKKLLEASLLLKTTVTNALHYYKESKNLEKSFISQLKRFFGVGLNFTKKLEKTEALQRLAEANCMLYLELSKPIEHYNEAIVTTYYKKSSTCAKHLLCFCKLLHVRQSLRQALDKAGNERATALLDDKKNQKALDFTSIDLEKSFCDYSYFEEYYMNILYPKAMGLETITPAETMNKQLSMLAEKNLKCEEDQKNNPANHYWKAKFSLLKNYFKNWNGPRDEKELYNNLLYYVIYLMKASTHNDFLFPIVLVKLLAVLDYYEKNNEEIENYSVESFANYEGPHTIKTISEANKYMSTGLATFYNSLEACEKGYPELLQKDIKAFKRFCFNAMAIRQLNDLPEATRPYELQKTIEKLYVGVNKP